MLSSNSVIQRVIQGTVNDSEIKAKATLPILNKYSFNDGQHYIKTHHKLSSEEENTLSTMLLSFPYAKYKDTSWVERFSEFKFENFPRHLIKIAVNAYDEQRNTMLGVACKYGKNVDLVQKLINHGAKLNIPDDLMNKLPLHWAIVNELAIDNPDSYGAVAVVECLLKNGARTDITCYQDITPLEYAKDRKFLAAAKLIETYEIGYNKGALTGLFFKKLPGNFDASRIANFSDCKYSTQISHVNKSAYDSAKKEGFEMIDSFMAKISLTVMKPG